MRVLLTSTRAPVTLELARAFAREGHTVIGADTFAPTIGAWSKAIHRHVVVSSPRFERERFVDGLEAIAQREAVDLVIPTCEEVFAIGYGRDRLSNVSSVFVSDLSTLGTLHDKWTLTDLAASLGLSTPLTDRVTSEDELQAATQAHDRWIAKPVYSRFATRVVSNVEGVSRRSVGEVKPSTRDPWIVQAFVDGPTECSYSIVHEGRITAHVAYATPVRHGSGSGVRFSSVNGGPSLDVATMVASATKFTGHLSFDFVRGERGLTLLECNPRATSGVHLMEATDIVRSLTDASAPMHLVPAGRTRQLLLPTIASLAARAGTLGEAVRALRFGDVITRRADIGPSLAQIPMAWHFLRVARRERLGLAAATTFDIEWNGDGD